jgi:hypothetical protein
MDELQESRFQIVDRNTGEEVNDEDFLRDYFGRARSEQKRGFEITYPYKMLKFMLAADSPRMRVLAYLLEVKTSQNLIVGTVRSLSTDSGIPKNTVHAVMKRLQSDELLVMVNQGVYLLNPDVMVYGGNNAWRTKDIWTKHFKK